MRFKKKKLSKKQKKVLEEAWKIRSEEERYKVIREKLEELTEEEKIKKINKEIKNLDTLIEKERLKKQKRCSFYLGQKTALEVMINWNKVQLELVNNEIENLDELIAEEKNKKWDKKESNNPSFYIGWTGIPPDLISYIKGEKNAFEGAHSKKTKRGKWKITKTIIKQKIENLDKLIKEEKIRRDNRIAFYSKQKKLFEEAGKIRYKKKEIPEKEQSEINRRKLTEKQKWETFPMKSEQTNHDELNEN